jgi:N-methylhydantoinase A
MHLKDLSVEQLRGTVRSLTDRVRGPLVDDGLDVTQLRIEADLKYRAQPETLTIPLQMQGSEDPLPPAVAVFHDQHEKRFGLRRDSEPIDLVTLRAIGMGPSTEAWSLSPPLAVATLAPRGFQPREWYRDGEPLHNVQVVALGEVERVEGPIFIEDAYTTLAIPPGATAERDRLGGILLEVGR